MESEVYYLSCIPRGTKDGPEEKSNQILMVMFKFHSLIKTLTNKGILVKNKEEIAKGILQTMHSFP